MKRSRSAEEIGPYLADESRLSGGRAEEIAWPRTAAEAAALLAEWNAAGLPVTVSGGGTGVVGGRVPFGGAILATEGLDRLGPIVKTEHGGRVRVGAGVSLVALQEAVAEAGLHYPPDPTESGAFLGGTLATNASGARTFRFGPTRAWASGLSVALADGSLLELTRGEYLARRGAFELALPGGRTLSIPAPNWSLPGTSKHAAGYHAAPELDLVDLFIGSEGTLGVILEAELCLLPAPREILAGIFFFANEAEAYAFVDAARGPERTVGEEGVRPWSLELFAHSALEILRSKNVALPQGAHTAIFFEEGVPREDDDGEARLESWVRLGERHGASPDSWLASSAQDDRRFREFRHLIPVTINEILTRRGVQKVSTDTAVPRGGAPRMLAAFRERLDRAGMERAIFGHVGDDHVHVNVIPRDPGEQERASALFWEMIELAAGMGGSVAAEHGLGKVKARALEIQFGPAALARMRAIKEALDPAWQLARGTLLGAP